MSVELIEKSLREKVGQGVSLIQLGLDRYHVVTPFAHADGDHYGIVLKRLGGHWILTDEGQTYLRLSFNLDLSDLESGNRAQLMSGVLTKTGVHSDSGELSLEVPDEQYGDALFSFVQALTHVADIEYISRERVRSTFIEDVQSFLGGRIPANRISSRWHDESRDPDGKYTVDYRVNHLPKPIFLYALPSDDRVKDATISLLMFEKWSIPHQGIGIFEDQTEINRGVLARFTDVCDKLFSSFSGNEDRIATYLEQVIETKA